MSFSDNTKFARYMGGSVAASDAQVGSASYPDFGCRLIVVDDIVGESTYTLHIPNSALYLPGFTVYLKNALTSTPTTSVTVKDSSDNTLAAMATAGNDLMLVRHNGSSADWVVKEFNYVITPDMIFGDKTLEYWRGDLGITLRDSTYVTQWEGQILSSLFIQGTQSLQPSYNVSDSNFNNQNTVAFNGTHKLTTSISDDYNSCLFMVLRVARSTSNYIWQGSNYQIYVPPTLRVKVSTTFDTCTGDVPDSTAFSWFGNPDSGSNHEVHVNGGSNLNGPTFTVSRGVGLTVNLPQSSGNTYAEYAEIVVTNDRPTNDQINEWLDYVQSRYGVAHSDL